CLGPPFRRQDGGLLLTLGAKDGRLLVTLGSLYLCLLLTIRDVDGRLLLAFRLEDQRTLLLVGLLLQRESVEDGLGRGDVDYLDPVDPDSPSVGGRFQLRLQLGVDSLALAEGFIQRHAAEDRAQGGSRKLVDGNEVVAYAEQGQPGIDNLAEDGGIDADRDVVAR